MPVGQFIKRLVLGRRRTELAQAIRSAELEHGFSGSLKPKRLPLRTALLHKRAEHLQRIGEARTQLQKACGQAAQRLSTIGVRDKHKLSGLPGEVSLHGYLLSFLPAIAATNYLQKPVGERLLQVGLDANGRFHLILQRSARGVKATIRGVGQNSEVTDSVYNIPFKAGLRNSLTKVGAARENHEKLKQDYEKEHCSARKA